MPHKIITHRRADLYAQVWTEPIRDVAKRHGVSDVALAKMCRKHDIPVPGRGYWARIAAGHFDEPTPLPPLPDGGAEEWEVSRWVSEEGEASAPAEPEIPVPDIPVPATLGKPHALVSAAKSLLSRKKPNADGFLACYEHRCLSIKASPAELDRALRIADAFINACEERGMRVELAEGSGRPQVARDRVYEVPTTTTTRVLVEGFWIEVRLFEHYRVVHTPAPKPPKGTRGTELTLWPLKNRATQRRAPNGLLELQLSSGRRQSFCRDRRRKPLQARVGEAIAALSLLATGARSDDAEATRRQAVRERDARLKAAAERKAVRRRERDEKVLRSLQNWRTARELREYAAEAHLIAADGQCTVNLRSETGRLIRWAAMLARRLDPFERLRKDVAQHLEYVETRIGPGCEPEENRNRLRAEEDLIAELRSFIVSWREAQEIRAHVATCSAVLDGRSLQFEGGETAAEWLRWASEHADSIEPISGWKGEVARHYAQASSH